MSVGARVLFMLLTPGRSWTTRRSPHSYAMSEPADAVRQRSRSRTSPPPTRATPGVAGVLTCNSLNEESRTLPSLMLVALRLTRLVAPHCAGLIDSSSSHEPEPGAFASTNRQ